MNEIFSLKKSSLTSDTELDQTRVRIRIDLIVLLYMFVIFGFDGYTEREIWMLAAMIAVLACAIGAFVLVKRFPGHYPPRRLGMAVLDMGAITAFMYQGGAANAVLFPLYLWVTLGNGFRYGKNYLYFSQLLSLSGLFLLYSFVPYWQRSEHLPVFVMTLVIIPLYATSLIRKLTDAVARAEAANEAKSRFLSNMSHEIRTPLHGIIGIGELLGLRRYDAEYRKLCDGLSNSARLLLQLVNDVLDIAKIESGKSEITSADFDLHSLMSDTLRIFDNQAADKGIETCLVIDPGLARYWVGDANHIQQVLMNLIGNAIKFTHQGSVTLRVSQLAGDAGRPLVRFEVVDTGVGIPAEHLPRLFERFFQVEDSAKAKYRGTGLGTTIAKSLVEAMGGTIHVTSRENDGSKFWFDLPLKKGDVGRIKMSPLLALDDSMQLNREGRSLLRILVAEDNPVNQLIMKIMLEKAGFNFTLTSDGAEAMHALSDMPYDVAILDMQMPGLSGIEVCRRFKALHREASGSKIADGDAPAFIMLSANVGNEDRNLAIEAGFVECLPKPVAASELIALLDQMALHPYRKRAIVTDGGSGPPVVESNQA